MNTARRKTADDIEAVRHTAAYWAVRRDAGLSAAEAIEFELWLAADPRHAAAMRVVGETWSLLDHAPESFVEKELRAATQRRVRRIRLSVFCSLAAAAAIVLGVTLWRNPAPSPDAGRPALVAAGPRDVTLADGSLVRLRAGGELKEEFDAAERRVRLVRGEAHFFVEKNPAWPFVVVAGNVRVRAVGTAFNVNLQSSRVDVLVTDGKVRVVADDQSDTVAPLVEAGQRARVDTGLADSSVVVTRVDPTILSQTPAWRDARIRLGGATLAELAADFQRRFGVQLRLADAEIGTLRAGGRMRADDPETFARLLATTFDLDVEHAGDGAWVLRKKNSNSR